jgi:hypothetical protein
LTSTDENFCEEMNNPIQKLDGAPCITGWSYGVSSVTRDAKNNTNREFLMGHYVMNQDDVRGKSIKMMNASELMVLQKNCLFIVTLPSSNTKPNHKEI